jgi:hypothetical protein
MSYPLPGETVVETRRNVEFGHGYEPDEPLPADLIPLYRTLDIAWRRKEVFRLTWERSDTHATWDAYNSCQTDYEHRHNDLLRAMGAHKYKSYIYDGCRIRLVIEPSGCRRHRLEIEAIPGD